MRIDEGGRNPRCRRPRHEDKAASRVCDVEREVRPRFEIVLPIEVEFLYTIAQEEWTVAFGKRSHKATQEVSVSIFAAGCRERVEAAREVIGQIVKLRRADVCAELQSVA